MCNNFPIQKKLIYFYFNETIDMEMPIGVEQNLYMCLKACFAVVKKDKTSKQKPKAF